MGEVVTVACNIPTGVYLHVDEMKEEHEPVFQGGTRLVKKAYPPPREQWVLIHGPATPHGMAPKTLIAGGYALTPNVSADFWNAWVKQNVQADAVKNKCIYALPKGETAGWAKEHAALKSGLQPLDPTGDPRREKPINTKISNVVAG